MSPSPRRLKEQVKETVSELPVHAARFAVMGVGRALMLTDRMRKDYKDVRETGLGPVLGRLKDDAGNLTGAVVGMVSGGRSETRPASNGKAEPAPSRAAADSEISVGKPRPRPSGPVARPPKPSAATRPEATPRPKPAPKPAQKKPAPKPSAKDLPVPGYDDATLASVRARLRNLDAGQVGELRDYERAHKARADFLRMYENRIAKLKGEN